jgi:hypothetical protein
MFEISLGFGTWSLGFPLVVVCGSQLRPSSERSIKRQLVRGFGAAAGGQARQPAEIPDPKFQIPNKFQFQRFKNLEGLLFGTGATEH